jgi:hypothetical protein
MITLRTDPHAFVSELAFIHIHLDALPDRVQERAFSTHCISLKPTDSSFNPSPYVSDFVLVCGLISYSTEICLGARPLGLILLEAGVPQTIDTRAYFRLDFQTDSTSDEVNMSIPGVFRSLNSHAVVENMRAVLPPASVALLHSSADDGSIATDASRLFGRCNVIRHAETGECICEVIEIMPPLL